MNHVTPVGFAELSGQSSLSGRMELPTSPINQLREIRQLSPILEERPPVRPANKPTPEECRRKLAVRFLE